MIKNYKLFKESLLDKLQGPTKDDIMKSFKDEPKKLLKTLGDAGYISEDDVKEIVDKMILNKDKRYLNQYLITFCEYGIPYGIEKIIEMGADINHDDGVPLFTAVSNKKYNSVKKLIELGVNLHVYNNWVIKIAIRLDNIKDVIGMLNILLENGASINKEDDYYIYLTINMHHEYGAELFEILVNNGQEIDQYLLKKLVIVGNLPVLKVALKYIDKSWVNDLINSVDNILNEPNIKKKTINHYIKIKNLLKKKYEE